MNAPDEFSRLAVRDAAPLQSDPPQVGLPSDDRPHVDLQFARAGGGRSFLSRQFVRYPFHVCRPHHDAQHPVACSLTLQSLSGGVFEHDALRLGLAARDGARVRVATAASTVVHMMTGGKAEQTLTLVAERGGWLEFLPEAQILFPGSHLVSRTRIVADTVSTVLACEIFLAHDPARRARPERPAAPFKAFDARVDVVRPEGRLLARERCLIDGNQWLARRVGLSNTHAVHAGLWIIDRRAGDALAGVLREQIDVGDDDGEGMQAADAKPVDQANPPDANAAGGRQRRVYAGVSTLPNGAGLQVRLLSDDAVAIRRLIQRLADAARSALTTALDR